MAKFKVLSDTMLRGKPLAAGSIVELTPDSQEFHDLHHANRIGLTPEPEPPPEPPKKAAAKTETLTRAL